MRNPTFKYYADVCQCGRPKTKKAKLCIVCHEASRGGPNPKYLYQYDLCPKCGGYKKKTSAFCRTCGTENHSLDEINDKHPWYGNIPDYSHLPDWFWAWLSGFVCGEGSITFQSGSSLRLTINLHSDDEQVLKLLRDQLGGSFYYNNPKKKLASWTINGSARVGTIIEKLLPYARHFCVLKAQDMKIALDFIQWRMRFGKKLPPSEKANFEEWRNKMKAVKVRSKFEA